MDCQLYELAGAPIGPLVGPETHAGLADNNHEGQKSIAMVAAMLDAFASVLAAEEILLAAARHEPASSIRGAGEIIRAVTWEAIEAAIAAQSDAFERVKLLRFAVDLEGVNSALVARCAMALANTISPAASALSV